MGDDVGFICDDPLDDLALLELHRLGHGGGEVDIILVGPLFAGNKLNFGWVSHGVFVLVVRSSRYARCFCRRKTSKKYGKTRSPI